MEMNIKKVLNDGSILGYKVTFLTLKGNRTPKEIWVGYDSMGEVYIQDTKKGLIKLIERNERLRLSHPELF